MPRLDSHIENLENWTYRFYPAQIKPERLLLMIHGWTGDENSMWIFPGNFPKNYWFLAPRAPWQSPNGGYSWRETRQAWPTVEDFRPAVNQLLEFVDYWAEKKELDVSTFDVIGFSQGGAMAASLAFLYPQRVKKVGIMAGFVPVNALPNPEEKPLHGKTIFVAHGTQDQTVSIELAKASMNTLRAGGAEVIYSEADVGHKLSLDSLKALEKYLAD